MISLLICLKIVAIILIGGQLYESASRNDGDSAVVCFISALTLLAGAIALYFLS